MVRDPKMFGIHCAKPSQKKLNYSFQRKKILSVFNTFNFFAIDSVDGDSFIADQDCLMELRSMHFIRTAICLDQRKPEYPYG